jgi:hypothetical protein
VGTHIDTCIGTAAHPFDPAEMLYCVLIPLISSQSAGGSIG